MLPRASLEDGKDSNRWISRMLPSTLLKFFIMFLALGFACSLLSIYMTRYFRFQQAATSVQPCYGVPDDLHRWILPPADLKHKMTDKELLWRASFEPRIKKYPFARVPKIAFLFLTKGPLPLYPLWEEFLKGHEGFYSIYIHSLPSYKSGFPSTSVFYRRHIPSKVAEWGQMSMCDAERRLLANALLDISNEWFTLLSESCIPLFNFSFTYTYLIKSHHSYVGSFDDPGPYGRGRYNINMAPLVNLTNWRKGSQWFAVMRKLAVRMVEDTKYYSKFREFCKPPCYVDEHYFPTMLSIEMPQLLANRTLSWVDWSRGGAHPATFGAADITDGFLTKIRHGKCLYEGQQVSICHLFARKFAPSTLEPLLGLAPKRLDFG